MENRRPRRTGSREVSSRLLLSPASSPASGSAFSPVRHRSTSDPPSKLRSTTASFSCGRRPFSRTPGTLADHLAERNACDKPASTTTAAAPQSIIRQQSCSKFGRFDGKDETEKKGRRSKENLPIGGSMRYIGKIRFPRSPKPGSPPSPSSASPLVLTSGRILVDENALPLRRKSDFGLHHPSLESDQSETKIPTPRIPKSEAARVVAAKAISRARSMTAYGSASTQWALSPGRRSGSPPAASAAEGRAAGTGRSFSNLRPPSPGKGRKVGSFRSMGLDLFHFRRWSSVGGGVSSSPMSSPFHSSLIVGSPCAGRVGVMGEMGHLFRLMHNRLIQWGYVNKRSDAVNGIRMANSEVRGVGLESLLPLNFK